MTTELEVAKKFLRRIQTVLELNKVKETGSNEKNSKKYLSVFGMASL